PLSPVAPVSALGSIGIGTRSIATTRRDEAVTLPSSERAVTSTRTACGRPSLSESHAWYHASLSHASICIDVTPATTAAAIPPPAAAPVGGRGVSPPPERIRRRVARQRRDPILDLVVAALGLIGPRARPARGVRQQHQLVTRDVPHARIDHRHARVREVPVAE